jgi:hypothetical protein
LVSTSFGAPAGQYTAAGLALRPDGRIVAAGGPLFAQNGSDFFVARYGAPDVPAVVQSSQPPAATPPATPRKKKCKKKRHGAASVAKKKCKKKKNH